ncbi:MAG: YigZ family protein [Bacteroidales bacterium]|nr:YigZ family protein [Bacteroidales bacterium]
MKNNIFRTIFAPSEAVFKEKRSKFFAFAFPVENEAEIKEKIAFLKKKYHDASHHCYAYILGADKSAYRMNDDGEPPGTAGRPIYGQLLSKNLSNVLVVVVRYFGGVKLGTGGLRVAYKLAAKEVLENALIVEKNV